MKTVALLLLGLVAFAHASTESPIEILEGIILGLQKDAEDISSCLVAYHFIQTRGIATL